MKYPVYFKNKKKLALLYLMPQLMIITVFFLYPSIQSFIQSLFVQDTFGLSQKFIGFKTYMILLSDPLYYEVLFNTIWMSFLIVVFSLVPAIFLALAVHSLSKGKQFLQTIFVLPQVIAPSIAGILWLFLFNPNIGIIVQFLDHFGITWSHALNNSQAVMLIVLVSVWNNIGYNFIFISSALYGIPKSVVEASMLDDMSAWSRFWHVTLPLLSPTMIYLIVMNIVYAFFNTFSIIDMTTKGGPGRSTTSLAYKIFIDGFRSSNFSSSAAQSVLILIMVSVLILIQYRSTEKNIHYH